MLSNITNITCSRRKLYRLVHLGLVALALMVIATPGFAAGAQPASPGSPQSPNATCPPNGQCFADVPPNNPFYVFVNRIYQQNLVSGNACGGLNEPCDAYNRPYFRPNNNVTRGQLAKFKLVRAWPSCCRSLASARGWCRAGWPMAGRLARLTT